MDTQDIDMIRGVAEEAAALCGLSPEQCNTLAEVLPGILAQSGAMPDAMAADVVTVISGDWPMRARVVGASWCDDGTLAAIECERLDKSGVIWTTPRMIHEQGKLAAILDELERK